MPSPRPIILPLIRSCNPQPHHLPNRILRSQPHRPLLLRQNRTIPHRRSYSSPSPRPPSAPKSYTFEELTPLSTTPSPRRILIDVREPSELAQTGRIPGAYNMPLTSNPDAFYMSNEDFLDKFGFEKPRAATTSDSGGEADGREAVADGNPFSSKMKEREADSGLNADGVGSRIVNHEADTASVGGKGVEEVIFYCKAGVRSLAAARMAREWEGVKIGQYAEGWVGWEKRGGKAER